MISKGVDLSIVDLFSGYGEKDIIKSLNMEIKRGEIVSICGPNGAGKTTLFKTLSSYIKPRLGKIYFDKSSIDNYSFKQLSKIIAVIKQQIIPAKISVYDYVSMGRFPYYKPFQFFRSLEDKERCEHYIELTKLTRLKDKMLNEISGGERQLAQIAKGLCQEPKLLLLDEPISSLDISHQIQIMDLIRDLNRELKFTAIFILHDLNLASEYSNRVALLSKGKIHSFDKPEIVLNSRSIQEVYNAKVIIEKNSLSNKPMVIPVSKDYENIIYNN